MLVPLDIKPVPSTLVNEIFVGKSTFLVFSDELPT
jgi:hypothetical protein